MGLWSGGKIAAVAHSRFPLDIRTSAFAIFDGSLDSPQAYEQVRATGSAIAIGISGDSWETSQVGSRGFLTLKKGKFSKLPAFFKKHHQEFSPDAVYRAKTWGQLDSNARQLEFVDSGLMPLVEAEMGRKISQLLEDCVRTLAGELGWQKLGESRAEEKKAEWLIQAPFWLLAAKALRDKKVPGFIRLKLEDFDTVFRRLAKHYSSDENRSIQVPKNRVRALLKVAGRIESFASLELLSAEALGYVYESTLINKATRKRLGTHSTPTWLIDYTIGKLRPWIAEIPEDERFVFEPACGHGGFLVSALRLLDELRTPESVEPRHSYLRKRLCGVDIDAFSQEVARLALTLADVPNPNGWNLMPGDMFATDVIETESRRAKIVLLNPPFESFGKSGEKHWLPNIAAETLRRIVENLPEGGVLGFIGPQGILQNKQGREIRKILLKKFEIHEVVLFADKVFEFGEPESTLILARKLKATSRRAQRPIVFSRVREGDVESFSRNQRASSHSEATATELLLKGGTPMFLPRLNDVWRYLDSQSKLGELFALGQGLFHRGGGDFIAESDTAFPDGEIGFAGWNKRQMTHLLPEPKFLNTSDSVIDREIMGLDPHPHVLMNYSPVSRGAWRLKALVDNAGHPITSRFIAIHPLNAVISLNTIWALFNSPVANAFVSCHLGKRDNLVGTLRKFPVPDLLKVDLSYLEELTTRYLQEAENWSSVQFSNSSENQLPLFGKKQSTPKKLKTLSEEELRILHLRIDAEVLRLYSLPPEMERQVLDLFVGERRKGVPFEQIGYFPSGFKGLNTVSELVTVLADWEPLAERKSILIRKKAAKKAGPAELKELAKLKRLSAARRDLLAPLPMAEAEAFFTEATEHK